MSKYYKAEDIINFLNVYCPKDMWEYQIADLPTIDIVNCIECAYLGEDWWCYKHEFTPIPIEDYFCKDGERIEE